MKLVLLSVLFGLGASITVDDCPAGVQKYKYLKAFGDNCYSFHLYGIKDYYDARQDCQKNNGLLAMPKTKAINDFLAKALAGFGVKYDTWIGLNDEESEEKFYWEDNTPASWENFKINEGHDHGILSTDWEDCVAMSRDGFWHDHHCDSEFFGLLDQRKPYICQHPATKNGGGSSTSGTGSSTDAPGSKTTATCPSIECELDCVGLGYQTDASGCFMCKCKL